MTTGKPNVPVMTGTNIKTEPRTSDGRPAPRDMLISHAYGEIFKDQTRSLQLPSDSCLLNSVQRQ